MTADTYPATSHTILDLHDIGAAVTVTASSNATEITVDATGPATFTDAVKIHTTATEPPVISVTAPGTQTGINVTGSGNVTVIGTTQHNVFASGNTVIYGHSGGGRIIVNGVDVTDTVNIKGPAPKIRITVPLRTRIRVTECTDVTVEDTASPIQAVVSGQDTACFYGAEDLHLTASGQAVVVATRTSGQVSMTASGQAVVRLRGELTHVNMFAAGQAKITVDGRAQTLTGSASGQAKINVEADIDAPTGPIIDVTGQATATHKGSRLGAPQARLPRWSW